MRQLSFSPAYHISFVIRLATFFFHFL